MSCFALPECEGSPTEWSDTFEGFKNWTDCVGEFTITSEDEYSGEKYVGEFKDGQKDGQGTYTFPNGKKYVGEFKDGKMHGQGTYTWPSGQKYVGK